MRKILKTLEKVNKNNVSYFEAGYMAGLLKSEIITPTQIIDLHYATVDFKNKMLKYLYAYDNEKYHEQALRKMFKVK